MKKRQWAKAQKDYKPDPLFADLPKSLKDPACYKNVLDQISQSGESGHDHKYAITWSKCKVCQAKFMERRAKVKSLGFTSYQQFLKWKKVVDVIVNKREIYIPNK